MPRTAVAPALVSGAVLASLAGLGSAADLLLLVAVPFAALAVLDGVSAVVAGGATPLRVALRVTALVLVLTGAATHRTGIALLSLAALGLEPLETMFGSFLATRRLSSRRVRARRPAASPTP